MAGVKIKQSEDLSPSLKYQKVTKYLKSNVSRIGFN